MVYDDDNDGLLGLFDEVKTANNLELQRMEKIRFALPSQLAERCCKQIFIKNVNLFSNFINTFMNLKMAENQE